MTTWKLPDLPGEIESDDAAVFLTGGVSYVELNVPGVGRVTLPAEALTEVKPPLPPEPPNDSAVRVGRQIHRRDDLAAYNDEGSDACWFGAGFTAPHTWAELCAKSAPSGPVLLVPAPEPVTLPTVELPWKGEGSDLSGDVYVGMSKAHEGRVYAFVNGGHLTPDTADAMAAALTTAAAKARQTDA